ncbi:TetR/AcrR family transcriptional regulator [Deferrisoma palaeochoriense]
MKKSVRTRPRALSSKGRKTRAALLEAAHDVFKEVGYYAASVAQIARRCEVSPGTFYQYFDNKEQVFLELNDLVVSGFLKKSASIACNASDFGGRLRSEVALLLEHTRENFAFHRILGESDLVDKVTISYYEAIARHYRDFFRQQHRLGNIAGFDPNLLAYALIGICYFNNLSWEHSRPFFSFWETVELIVDLLKKGVAGPAPWNDPPDLTQIPFRTPPPSSFRTDEPMSKGERTRQAIFRAAETVFGRNGFSRANIADITREANVAQGTFYVHFESKSDLIEGFIKHINREARREIQQAIAGIEDRREAELVGIWAFFDFLRRHRAIYRLIPEFEMIAQDVGMWYYNKIAQGYLKGVKKGIERGQLRDLPPTFLVRSIMGLTHFIGLKWIVWAPDDAAEFPSPLFRDLAECLLYGLEPRR